MALEIEGKVVQIGGLETGQGKSGPWQKHEFTIETVGEYPKKVHFSAWGDKTDVTQKLLIGQKVKISFNAESREFNEKWYTDLKVWKIEMDKNGTKPQPGNKLEDIKNKIDDFPDDVFEELQNNQEPPF